MTYPQFLLLFLVPPLLVMLWLTRPLWDRQVAAALVVLTALALAYTSPWDNYLVIRGVWFFDAERVWGRFIWRVPLEEYLFYVLQVLITGLFTVWLLARRKRRAR
jgi:lycopene cyclase domain-containing protein